MQSRGARSISNHINATASARALLRPWSLDRSPRWFQALRSLFKIMPDQSGNLILRTLTQECAKIPQNVKSEGRVSGRLKNNSRSLSSHLRRIFIFFESLVVIKLAE